MAKSHYPIKLLLLWFRVQSAHVRASVRISELETATLYRLLGLVIFLREHFSINCLLSRVAHFLRPSTTHIILRFIARDQTGIRALRRRVAAWPRHCTSAEFDLSSGHAGD